MNIAMVNHLRRDYIAVFEDMYLSQVLGKRESFSFAHVFPL